MSGGSNLRGNLVPVLLCLGITSGMLGMSYAAVPLYRIFCQVTGYGGTTQRAEGPVGKIIDRTIAVRFDGNVSSDLNWSFKPVEREIDVRLGEVKMASYAAKNLGARTSWGTATFNVVPQSAGQYFNKIDCFCFTEQELKSGESADMPVQFFIDPAILDDPEMKDVRAITLSYTFFADEEPEAVKAASTVKTGRKTKSAL